MKLKHWAILIACLLATTVIVAQGLMLSAFSGKADDLRVKAEKLAADAKGIATATREKLTLKDARIGELEEQIEAVRSIAPEVRTETVTQWRTREVEVPIEVLIPIQGPPEAPNPGFEAVECPTLADLPAPRLRASGNQATLRSQAGTLFAVGEVIVSIKHSRHMPWQEIFREPWESDLTQVVEGLKTETRGWRLTVMGGLTTDPGWAIGANLQRTGRLGYWAILTTPFNPEDYRYYLGDGEYQSVDEQSRYTLAGGLSYTMGRR